MWRQVNRVKQPCLSIRSSSFLHSSKLTSTLFKSPIVVQKASFTQFNQQSSFINNTVSTDVQQNVREKSNNRDQAYLRLYSEMPKSVYFLSTLVILICCIWLVAFYGFARHNPLLPSGSKYNEEQMLMTNLKLSLVGLMALFFSFYPSYFVSGDFADRLVYYLKQEPALQPDILLNIISAFTKFNKEHVERFYKIVRAIGVDVSRPASSLVYIMLQADHLMHNDVFTNNLLKADLIPTLVNIAESDPVGRIKVYQILLTLSANKAVHDDLVRSSANLNSLFSAVCNSPVNEIRSTAQAAIHALHQNEFFHPSECRVKLLVQPATSKFLRTMNEQQQNAQTLQAVQLKRLLEFTQEEKRAVWKKVEMPEGGIVLRLDLNYSQVAILTAYCCTRWLLKKAPPRFIVRNILPPLLGYAAYRAFESNFSTWKNAAFVPMFIRSKGKMDSKGREQLEVDHTDWILFTGAVWFGTSFLPMLYLLATTRFVLIPLLVTSRTKIERPPLTARPLPGTPSPPK